MRDDARARRRAARRRSCRASACPCSRRRCTPCRRWPRRPDPSSARADARPPARRRSRGSTREDRVELRDAVAAAEDVRRAPDRHGRRVVERCRDAPDALRAGSRRGHDLVGRRVRRRQAADAARRRPERRGGCILHRAREVPAATGTRRQAALQRVGQRDSFTAVGRRLACSRRRRSRRAQRETQQQQERLRRIRRCCRARVNAALTLARSSKRRLLGIAMACARLRRLLAALAARSGRARLDDAGERRAEHRRPVDARHAGRAPSSSRGTRRSAGTISVSRNHGAGKVLVTGDPIAGPHAARAAAERRDPALLPERAGRRAPDLDRRRPDVDRPDPDAVAHAVGAVDGGRGRARRHAVLRAGRHRLRQRLPGPERRAREERLPALLRLRGVPRGRHDRARADGVLLERRPPTGRSSTSGSAPTSAPAGSTALKPTGIAHRPRPARRRPARRHVPRLAAGAPDATGVHRRPVPRRRAGGRRRHLPRRLHRRRSAHGARARRAGPPLDRLDGRRQRARRPLRGATASTSGRSSPSPFRGPSTRSRRPGSRQPRVASTSS